MAAVGEWLGTRARELAASLNTVPHARAIVAGSTAVVFLAGVLGLAMHDGEGNTNLEANRRDNGDLTPDNTDTTFLEAVPPTSLLPPVVTTPIPGVDASTTTTTVGFNASTTTTVATATGCSGAGSVVQGTGLWVVDVAAGRVRQVVGEESAIYTWAPDGASIAYLTGPQDRRRLAVFDLASGTSRTLYGDLPVWAGPAWTADSKHLVFAARPDAARDRLYRVPAAGGDAAAVHDLASLAGDVEVRPDGSIVFTDGGTLAMVDADGTNRRTLIQAGTPRSVQTIALSPDGARVAYNDRLHLGILTVADAKTVEVSTSDPPGFPLGWSTDGARVSWVRVTGGRQSGVAAKADGTEMREVGVQGSDFSLAPSGRDLGWVADKSTTPKANATGVVTGVTRLLGTKMWQPTWAPRTDDLAVYATLPDQPRPALCIMQAGGYRKLVQLSPSSAPYSALSWSPSGATLAFASLG